MSPAWPSAPMAGCSPRRMASALAASVASAAGTRRHATARPGPGGAAAGVACSPDGGTLAAADYSEGDGGVVLFDAATGRRRHANTLPLDEPPGVRRQAEPLPVAEGQV